MNLYYLFITSIISLNFLYINTSILLIVIIIIIISFHMYYKYNYIIIKNDLNEKENSSKN